MEWSRLQARLAGTQLRLDAPPTTGAPAMAPSGPPQPPPQAVDGDAPVVEPGVHEVAAESWVHQLPYLDVFFT